MKVLLFDKAKLATFASFGYFDDCQTIKVSNDSAAFSKDGRGWDSGMTEKDLTRISKALSDPTRLRIYKEIASRAETNCGKLIKCCPLTAGTISHHLRILAEAGLIESRREGQFIYNRAMPATLRQYARALNNLTGKSKIKS